MAIWAYDTPPSRLTVPVKQSTIMLWPMPMASKIWAPWYDRTVEMPIFDMTFNTPRSHALM